MIIPLFLKLFDFACSFAFDDKRTCITDVLPGVTAPNLDNVKVYDKSQASAGELLLLCDNTTGGKEYFEDDKT